MISIHRRRRRTERRTLARLLLPGAAMAWFVVIALTSCRTESTVPSGSGLNVLLISIDTLRADHLGCYGYAVPTSPNLDALAASGVRFSRAISQAPWTTPSHMTLMTSLYPTSHQLNQAFEDYRTQARVLADERVTLAEVLREHGYGTLALTGGASMSGELGFRQGFDEYLQDYYKLDETVWERFTELLDRHAKEPFFFFLHTFHVHAPYLDTDLATGLMSEDARQAMWDAIVAAGSEDIAGQKAYLEGNGFMRLEVTKALYDGGIRAADAFLGRLFDELRRRDLYERTLIVVVSDHGEEFADHDPERVYNSHGYSQYEELVHVPLIVRFPRFPRAGRTVTSEVGLIDVAPTILDLLGLPIPEVMQGRSLKRLWVSESPVRRSIGSEATTARRVEIKALRTREFSYIATYAAGARNEHTGIPGRLLEEKLFDLIGDPREQADLASRDVAATREMRRALEALFGGLERGIVPTSIPMDRELEESLRNLGYLH